MNAHTQHFHWFCSAVWICAVLYETLTSSQHIEPIHRDTDWDKKSVCACVKEREREGEWGVKFMSWGSNSFLIVLFRLTHLPRDPSGRSEKGKAWVSVQCVYRMWERDRERGRENKSNESQHTRLPCCALVPSPGARITIYSNQAVTFSSTPAGTSATLCAVCTNTPTHTPNISSPCTQDFSQGQTHLLDYKVVLPCGANIHTTVMGFVLTHFEVDHSNPCWAPETF